MTKLKFDHTKEKTYEAIGVSKETFKEGENKLFSLLSEWQEGDSVKASVLAEKLNAFSEEELFIAALLSCLSYVKTKNRLEVLAYMQSLHETEIDHTKKEYREAFGYSPEDCDAIEDSMQRRFSEAIQKDEPLSFYAEFLETTYTKRQLSFILASLIAQMGRKEVNSET